MEIQEWHRHELTQWLSDDDGDELITDEKIDLMLMKVDKPPEEFISKMYGMLEEDCLQPGFSAPVIQSPEIVRRRKQSVLDNLDRYMKQAEGLKLWSKEISITRMELFPSATYFGIEEDRHVNLAAALYLLDKLYINDLMDQAYDIIPCNIENDNIWTPAGFYHPCFSRDLVASVVCVVSNDELGDIFDDLLCLLDDEIIKNAADSFSGLQDKAALAFLKAEEYFDRVRFRLAPEIYAVRRQIDNPLIFRNDDEPGKKMDALAAELASSSDDQTQFEQEFWKYFGDHAKKVMDRGKLAKLMAVEIEDPYEICFGFEILRHMKSPSLFRQVSACAALNAAGRMLPWYGCADDFYALAYMEGVHYTDGGWITQEEPENGCDLYHHFEEDGLNAAQRIYRLSKGVMPGSLHPFERQRRQMLEGGIKNADYIASCAEFLFLANTQLGTERPLGDLEDDDLFDELDEYPDDEREEGCEEETDTMPDTEPSDTETNSPPEETADKKKLQKMGEELAELKKQNKSLMAALSEMRRNHENESGKFKEKLREYRREHRELADLRELAFNLDHNLFNDGAGDDKTEEIGISFPYSPKLRTVIFGGHDSFLREIRQKLPDVTYVSTRLYNFDPSIIRNADVVWIQNNAISHSQYWRAIDIAKKYNVQLRYFTCASAHKCAMTLAKWDGKNE